MKQEAHCNNLFLPNKYDNFFYVVGKYLPSHVSPSFFSAYLTIRRRIFIVKLFILGRIWAKILIMYV